MIGKGADKCGAIANKLALSCSASFTRRYCQHKTKEITYIGYINNLKTGAKNAANKIKIDKLSSCIIQWKYIFALNMQITCSLSNCIMAFCR